LDVILFSGMGSQSLGMGKELYEKNKIIREKIDFCSKYLGFDLYEKVFYSDDETVVNAFEFSQLSIFCLNHAIFEYLKYTGFQIDYVLGHSLGEYNALVAAGILQLTDALSLLKIRIEKINEANKNEKGAMGAILGLSEEIVEEFCDEINKDGLLVEIANFNGPNQIVVSGHFDSVNEVIKLARKRRVISNLIDVNAASHSFLMTEANKEIAVAIEKIKFSNSNHIQMISSITGNIVLEIDEYIEHFKYQLRRPVYWDKSIKTCIENKIERFIVIGSSPVLKSLVKGIDNNLNVFNIGTQEQTDELHYNQKIDVNI